MKNLRTNTALFGTIKAKNGSGLHLQDDGGNGIFIEDGGNVGIGTTNPNLIGLQLGTSLVVSSGTGGDIVAHRSGSSVNVGDICGALLIANSDTDGSEDHFVGIWGKVSSTNGSQDLHFAAGRSGYEGDAPQLTIDSTGNVGIGISDPTKKLSIFDQIDGSPAEDQNYGEIGFGSRSDGTTPVVIKGLAGDNLNGTDGKLQFLTTNNTVNQAPAPRMTIDHVGNVGIGTTNPNAANFVVHEDNNIWHAAFGVDGGDQIRIGGATPDGSVIGAYANNLNSSPINLLLQRDGGSVAIGTTNPGSTTLYVNGSTWSTTGWSSSDDRVKHNEQAIVGAIETLGKITPKKYIKTIDMYEADHDFELDADGNPVDANGEPVEHSIEAGVIAQQVLGVPELAFMVSPEGVDEDGNVTSPHGLDYNSLFTYAIAAIQEQQQIIEDLKSQNESLAARITALEG